MAQENEVPQGQEKKEEKKTEENKSDALASFIEEFKQWKSGVNYDLMRARELRETLEKSKGKKTEDQKEEQPKAFDKDEMKAMIEFGRLMADLPEDIVKEIEDNEELSYSQKVAQVKLLKKVRSLAQETEGKGKETKQQEKTNDGPNGSPNVLGGIVIKTRKEFYDAQRTPEGQKRIQEWKKAGNHVSQLPEK